MQKCCKNCWYWWHGGISNICNCEESKKHGDKTKPQDCCPKWQTMKRKKVPCSVCGCPTNQEYFPESEHNTDTGKPYKIQLCAKPYCRAAAWERVREELRERTKKYGQY